MNNHKVFPQALNSFQARGKDLMEDMVNRMEQYTKNLEETVEGRTKNYLDEKKKVGLKFANTMPSKNITTT